MPTHKYYMCIFQNIFRPLFAAVHQFFCVSAGMWVEDVLYGALTSGVNVRKRLTPDSLFHFEFCIYQQLFQHFLSSATSTSIQRDSRRYSNHSY